MTRKLLQKQSRSRKRQMKSKKNQNALSITEHIVELRKRVIVCLLAFILAFVICYARSNAITEAFIEIGRKAGFTVGYLSPQELLIQALRLCATFAVIVDIPCIVIAILTFVTPVFSTKKGIIVTCCAAFFALVLFALGMIFCFEVLFPFVFKYLYDYTTNFSVQGTISIEAFLDFLLSTCWIMAFIFELPLMTAGLTIVGVVTPRRMLAVFKPALVIIMLVSAIVTPPDVISMFMVALPMTAIYMLSIFVSFVCKGGQL